MLEIFPWTRKIDAVHIHHTWRPNHAQWKGLESVRAMWRYHTSPPNNWSDIGQHLTIGRDGDVWTGRNWNNPPASATGYNGNAAAGPFMIEMNGDFDKGKDTLAGKQLEAVVSVVAAIVARFKLDPATAIRFHREMTDQKSCPGTGIDKKWLIGEVQKARKSSTEGARAAAPLPFDRDLLSAWCLDIGGAARGGTAQDEGEPAENDYDAPLVASEAVARGGRPTPDDLTALIPHVVNLREGKFASTELFHTDKSTVDTIISGLDRKAQTVPQNGVPLRIVLWAHGGLNTEATGLAIAQKHVQWWVDNGVYPIHFVWQTGLFQTIGDTIQRALGRITGARALDPFAIPDAAVEGLVRVLGGRHVWGGMKFSAKEASRDGNGAEYVADELAALIARHPGKVELHAIGHSAGAVFHSYFIPAVVANQRAQFATMQFLAPAVRVDGFAERLLGLMGGSVKSSTIFTMFKQFELADRVTRGYHKSLLYLISRALEEERGADILGLEESMRRSPSIVRAFGLDGRPAPGQVVFSKTAGRSQADEHGEFDDDPDTMNSVARLVLGGSNLVRPYPPTPAETRALEDDFELELPEEVQQFIAAAGAGTAATAVSVFAPPPPPAPLPAPYAPPSAPSSAPQSYGGTRRALCIGINDYPTAPLRGCVADARAWAAQLQAIGFSEITMLTDAQASRRAIVAELERLIAQSRAGDVIVFQTAGHGTKVPDLDGDERLRPNDSAFCPHDFASGALLIDDDVAAIFRHIPDGVLFTCFFDFCHSGEATRFAVGTANVSIGSGDRPRFIPADDALRQAHADFRRNSRTLGASRSENRGPDFMREVVFSACLPEQLAWESSGQGDFTRNVAPLLAQWQGMTNQQFQDLLTSNFRPAGRQNPILDCSAAARSQPFLGGASSTAIGRSTAGGDAVAQLLRDVATMVEAQGGR
jgi:hypothetical protein